MIITRRDGIIDAYGYWDFVVGERIRLRWEDAPEENFELERESFLKALVKLRENIIGVSIIDGDEEMWDTVATLPNCTSIVTNRLPSVVHARVISFKFTGKTPEDALFLLPQLTHLALVVFDPLTHAFVNAICSSTLASFEVQNCNDLDGVVRILLHGPLRKLTLQHQQTSNRDLERIFNAILQVGKLQALYVRDFGYETPGDLLFYDVFRSFMERNKSLTTLEHIPVNNISGWTHVSRTIELYHGRVPGLDLGWGNGFAGQYENARERSGMFHALLALYGGGKLTLIRKDGDFAIGHRIAQFLLVPPRIFDFP